MRQSARSSSEINFSFNSQAFVYSRSFLERLRADGPIYRSPFPDYYIANVALARSSSTVIVPEPMAIAGVSKASYGFTLYNEEEQRGEALLHVNIAEDPIYRELGPVILPGPAYNTNFLVSMEYVARSTQEKLGEKVAFKNYRRLQISAAVTGQIKELPAGELWPEVRRRLTLPEIVFANTMRFSIGHGAHFRTLRRLLAPRLERMANMIGVAPMPRYFAREDFKCISDVYDALENGVLT